MYIHQRHIRQDGKRSRGKDVSSVRKNYLKDIAAAKAGIRAELPD